MQFFTCEVVCCSKFYCLKKVSLMEMKMVIMVVGISPAMTVALLRADIAITHYPVTQPYLILSIIMMRNLTVSRSLQNTATRMRSVTKNPNCLYSFFLLLRETLWFQSPNNYHMIRWFTVRGPTKITVENEKSDLFLAISKK